MNTLSKLAKNKKALLVLAAAAFAVIAFAKPALLPFALLMLCPMMHLFMHGGHGSHGTHNAKTEAVKITHRPNLDTGDKKWIAENFYSTASASVRRARLGMPCRASE